jgi:hypothetical protein
MKVLPILFVLFVISSTLMAEDPSSDAPKPLFPDDPKGRNLPLGVPRMVDTNGNVVWLDHHFTSTQYAETAERLVLQEANCVAKELQLPEELPITVSNIVRSDITPFGFNYINKTIGTVTTKKYCYYVSRGNKFNAVDLVEYDKTCQSYRNHLLPIKEMNTNEAYHLATKWLAAVSVDVNGLNHKCKVHVALSPFWNSVAKLGDKPKEEFVPIYFVWWTSRQDDLNGHGNEAYVEFYSPDKTLLQLTVSDPKYILRKPLVFTNLNSLFTGTGAVYKLPALGVGGQLGPN